MATREWKYDVRFCKCGRIHMIPADKVESAIQDDKELVYICGGCGAVRAIGASKEPDWDDPSKTIYNMYTRDIELYDAVPLVIDVRDFEDKKCGHKNYKEILYSRGLRVPMMTGEYATSYLGGRFYDMWYPDWYTVDSQNATVAKIREFIDNYKHNQRTVNMERFIRETPEEYLDAISGYAVEGLKWKGTRWERK